MPLYPAVPGHRMAYDRDGSACFTTDRNGTLKSGIALGTYNFTPAQLNSESYGGYLYDESSAFTHYNTVGMIFPELRDIQGFFFNFWADNGGETGVTVAYWQTSVDSTSGVDGTWITQYSNVPNIGHGGWGVNTIPGYRSSITPSVTASVKAVRMLCEIHNGSRMFGGALHVYGMPSSGQNTDSLRIWQPVTNAEVGGDDFNFNDIGQGGTATKQFRVKNLSATKTASTITVTEETLTDASPTLVGQFQFSLDNITYGNSISVPNLGPGAVSAILYVRLNPSSSAALSTWEMRMIASAVTFA